MAVWADGILISEAMEVDTTIVSDDVVVKTILTDFPGITPGPSVRQIRFKNMMPISGPSVDFEERKIKKEVTTIRLMRLGSGAAMETKCFVTGNVTTTYGVGKNMEQDVELTGAAVLFE
jgi:hypothetical protein